MVQGVCHIADSGYTKADLASPISEIETQANQVADVLLNDTTLFPVYCICLFTRNRFQRMQYNVAVETATSLLQLSSTLFAFSCFYIFGSCENAMHAQPCISCFYV
jgi:hypothetical protein